MATKHELRKDNEQLKNSLSSAIGGKTALDKFNQNKSHENTVRILVTVIVTLIAIGILMFKK
jgi:hypothetical protein